jgi:hypothetical protein
MTCDQHEPRQLQERNREMSEGLQRQGATQMEIEAAMSRLPEDIEFLTKASGPESLERQMEALEFIRSR